MVSKICQMNQKSKHTEPTQYLYDNNTWLYDYVFAFFYGFVQNHNYVYDAKSPNYTNILPHMPYTHDAFGNMNYDYDYFCTVNNLKLQNTNNSISVARHGVFLKHTVSELETGMDYFGARYYSSDISIWLSVDPLAFKYPDQSPYSYVGNRPINTIDPWGMDEVEDPNGNKGNAGEGYKQTGDKKYLYGDGLDTKVWDPEELGSVSEGQTKGGYVDYEGDAIDFGSYDAKSSVNHYSGKDARIKRLLDKNPSNPISRAVWALNNRGMYPHLSGSLHMGKVNYSLPNVPDMVAINLQGSCIVGGGASLNLTIGEVHGQPFFAISPSIGSGFDISGSVGLTFGDYNGGGVPLPQSLQGAFIYQNGGAGALGATFTQDVRSKNGQPVFGNKWTTNSIDLNIGSKTIFGGSVGAGMTWTF